MRLHYRPNTFLTRKKWNNKGTKIRPSARTLTRRYAELLALYACFLCGRGTPGVPAYSCEEVKADSTTVVFGYGYIIWILVAFNRFNDFLYYSSFFNYIILTLCMLLYFSCYLPYVISGSASQYQQSSKADWLNRTQYFNNTVRDLVADVMAKGEVAKTPSLEKRLVKVKVNIFN